MPILAGHHTEDGLITALSEHGVKKTKRTLRIWRSRREGPPFTKVGNTILYPEEGFLDWLRSQTQHPLRSRRHQQKLNSV
jgi:hypothetical protein